MRLFSLRGDSRGAVAIEYAIVGALIGIGLIGALVGTKGSLSAIFGTAATQINPSGASSNPVTSQRAITPAFQSARAPYWNAKTLASKDVTNPTPTSQMTKFTYTDGSAGSYLAQYDATGKLVSEVVTSYPWGASNRTTDTMQVTYGADGSQQSLIYTNKNASGGLIQYMTAVAPGWLDQIDLLDGNGNVTYHYTNYNDPAQPQMLSQASADEIYFRALSQ